MLHIGAGHSNNCQITLKFFRYDIFCNNLQQKNVFANLEVSEVLITYVTIRGKARAMLHIGAGHFNNISNLEVSEVLITYVTNRGKGRLG